MTRIRLSYSYEVVRPPFVSEAMVPSGLMTRPTEYPEPLVPIRTELGCIRKVRTELDEERPEVAAHEVDVVGIGHRGRPADPRIRLARRVAAFVGAEDARLFLGFADEEQAFLTGERGQLLL